MYDCHAGRCGKIEDWKCERRCADIESPGKNVIIMSGGYLLVMSSVYQVFLDDCKVHRVISVVTFQRRDTKLKWFLAKTQLYFVN